MMYRKHIFICGNERPAGHERGCCKDKGGVDLRNYMKAAAKEMGLDDVRVNHAGCMDRCEQGPVMVVYPDAVWYQPMSNDDIDKILEKHIKNGQIVERLCLPKL
jgi:(2Fe-2S) ferredoxin